MLTTLEGQIATWDDPKYIPMATTYLNQERWNDYVAPPKLKPRGARLMLFLEAVEELKAGGHVRLPQWHESWYLTTEKYDEGITKILMYRGKNTATGYAEYEPTLEYIDNRDWRLA